MFRHTHTTAPIQVACIRTMIMPAAMARAARLKMVKRAKQTPNAAQYFVFVVQIWNVIYRTASNIERASWMLNTEHWTLISIHVIDPLLFRIVVVAITDSHIHRYTIKYKSSFGIYVYRLMSFFFCSYSMFCHCRCLIPLRHSHLKSTLWRIINIDTCIIHVSPFQFSFHFHRLSSIFHFWYYILFLLIFLYVF